MALADVLLIAGHGHGLQPADRLAQRRRPQRGSSPNPAPFVRALPTDRIKRDYSRADEIGQYLVAFSGTGRPLAEP